MTVPITLAQSTVVNVDGRSIAVVLIGETSWFEAGPHAGIGYARVVPWRESLPWCAQADDAVDAFPVSRRVPSKAVRLATPHCRAPRSLTTTQDSVAEIFLTSRRRQDEHKYKRVMQAPVRR